MSKRKCFLCKKDVENEIDMGEWKKKSGVDVHYYCLLLTSNLIQKGADTEGILGFLIKDIRAEVHRIKPQKCYLCQAGHAGIGCCAKKCMKTFHLSCGIENDCRNYFTGTYQSFCDKHHNIKHKKKHETSTDCGICYERMGKYNPLTSIQSACCKTGWFHKLCLQKFAKSAGYFFKCPLCNNTEEFRNDVMTRGVFVPDKDAEWEIEPNAFAELLERGNTCEAANCICPQSRDFCDNKEWDQTRCLTCGNSVHIKCISDVTENYICEICCKGKIDSETIAALKALSDDESSDESDDDENKSPDTSRMAGSSQNVSGSRRKTIVDYFSPPEKKITKTTPCLILLERLDINQFVKSDESSNGSTSYKLKSEVDECEVTINEIHERVESDESTIVPRLSKKWIDLLQATHESESDIEYKMRLSSDSSNMTSSSIGLTKRLAHIVDSESDIEDVTKRRTSKRLSSVSSNSTSSSICHIKKPNVSNVDSDSDIGELTKNRASKRLLSVSSNATSLVDSDSEIDEIITKKRASKRLLSDSSNTTSSSVGPVKKRRRMNVDSPEVCKTPVAAPICNRRRSVRLMSVTSSNRSYTSSPISTGRDIIRVKALDNHRKSVSSSDETQSSSSEKIKTQQIENNNNRDVESIKTTEQTDFLIDYHELNRIRQEMQALDVVARNHCNKLSSGSIYSAKDHLSKFMGKIADKKESYFSSTESESDLGIKDIVEPVPTVAESDLILTNEENDGVSDKYFFKIKTKDVSQKVNKRKSRGFEKKSLNKTIEKSPPLKENKSKKSPCLKTKPKFNMKSLQGQKNRIDNYFTVYTGSKN